METETINSKKSTVILRIPNSKKSIRQFTEGTVFVRIEFQAEGIDNCKDSKSWACDQVCLSVGRVRGVLRGHTMSSRLTTYCKISMAAESKHLETFIAIRWSNFISLKYNNTYFYMSFLFHFPSNLFFYYILQKHQSMMYWKLRETKQKQMVFLHRKLETHCVGGMVGRGEAT